MRSIIISCIYRYTRDYISCIYGYTKMYIYIYIYIYMETLGGGIYTMYLDTPRCLNFVNIWIYYDDHVKDHSLSILFKFSWDNLLGFHEDSVGNPA